VSHLPGIAGVVPFLSPEAVKRPALAVQLSQRRPLVPVGHDNPLPTLPVAAGGSLQCDGDALLDERIGTGRLKSSRLRTDLVVVSSRSVLA